MARSIGITIRVATTISRRRLILSILRCFKPKLNSILGHTLKIHPRTANAPQNSPANHLQNHPTAYKNGPADDINGLQGESSESGLIAPDRSILCVSTVINKSITHCPRVPMPTAIRLRRSVLCFLSQTNCGRNFAPTSEWRDC